MSTLCDMCVCDPTNIGYIHLSMAMSTLCGKYWIDLCKCDDVYSVCHVWCVLQSYLFDYVFSVWHVCVLLNIGYIHICVTMSTLCGMCVKCSNKHWIHSALCGDFYSVWYVYKCSNKHLIYTSLCGHV